MTYPVENVRMFNMIRLCTLLMMLLLLILLSACPYESSVTLSSPDQAKIDPELIGVWIFRDQEKKRDYEIPFIAFNDHEYLIVLSNDEETDYIRAFTTEITGRRFLNYKELRVDGTPEKYAFLRYEIKNDMLYLHTVEDELITKEFEHPAELYIYVKKHIADERLCSPFAVFKRARTKSGSQERHDAR
jgi:hypothetical protein